MRRYHRHLYQLKHSQNFIKSLSLAQSLVNMMNLNRSDYVIEIGPGKGSLTKPIIDKVQKFTGVELDTELYSALRSKYGVQDKVEFINIDFLKYRLPTEGKYKLVGNIPFALTADIIRRLLDFWNPPTDSYLIIQKEAAFRLVPKDYENFFALQYKPWFESKVLKTVGRKQFFPEPSVDTMLVHIHKREFPILSEEDRASYTKFISFCFLKFKVNVKSALKKFFTLKQLGIISRENKINFELKPSQLSFEQWLVLFDCYKQLVSKEKKLLIENN